jgi:hypothetical protein
MMEGVAGVVARMAVGMGERAGVSVDELLAGLPFDRVTLARRRRIDWDDYGVLLERLETLSAARMRSTLRVLPRLDRGLDRHDGLPRQAAREGEGARGERALDGHRPRAPRCWLEPQRRVDPPPRRPGASRADAADEHTPTIRLDPAALHASILRASQPSRRLT